MRELRSGTFVKTFASGGENSTLLTVLPFVVPLLVLLAIGVSDAMRVARARPAFAAFSAAGAVVAWLLVLEAGHLVYRDHNSRAATIAFALAAVVAVAALVAARESRSGAPG